MDSIFMKQILDRIYRICIFYFDHFPPARHRPPEADSGEAGGDENGQSSSPSAKTQQKGINNGFVRGVGLAKSYAQTIKVAVV